MITLLLVSTVTAALGYAMWMLVRDAHHQSSHGCADGHSPAPRAVGHHDQHTGQLLGADEAQPSRESQAAARAAHPAGRGRARRPRRQVRTLIPGDDLIGQLVEPVGWDALDDHQLDRLLRNAAR